VVVELFIYPHIRVKLWRLNKLVYGQEYPLHYAFYLCLSCKEVVSIKYSTVVGIENTCMYIMLFCVCLCVCVYICRMVSR
jgi:hypothetical protein